MAELIKEIIDEDLLEIEKLIKNVLKSEENYKNVERLGGMTNHSYKVTMPNGREYLMRVPGEGTEEMINRKDEKKSTELACKLGIDTELLYFDDNGIKVMNFIHGAKEVTSEIMKSDEVLKQAADIFRKLHTCGEDTGVKFEVFEMTELYENIIKKNNVKLYDDYYDCKNEVMRIKKEMDEINGAKVVPCHNDSLLANWVLDENNKLFLIDWEYSGMNEAMWDLSCLSIESDFNEEDDDKLLKLYYQRDYNENEKKYFIAAKMYVDLLWTLWGLTRVPFDGDFMQEYADERYNRLKMNIEKYKRIEKGDK